MHKFVPMIETNVWDNVGEPGFQLHSSQGPAALFIGCVTLHTLWSLSAGTDANISTVSSGEN